VNPRLGNIIAARVAAPGRPTRWLALQPCLDVTARVAVACLGLLLCGCAGRQPSAWLAAPVISTRTEDFTQAKTSLTNVWPSEYRAIQRAVITVGRRQFVCDGVLDVSPGRGWHLAVVSQLGLVSEVRLAANGACEVIKVTPLFPELWSRSYVARDLFWHFLPPSMVQPAGYLPDGRPVLESNHDGREVRWAFSSGGQRWQELEISRQGQRLYHSRLGQYRQFKGLSRDVPTDFRIEAERYQLHLRIVEMIVPGKTAAR
jgi:hypothetical protein